MAKKGNNNRSSGKTLAQQMGANDSMKIPSQGSRNRGVTDRTAARNKNNRSDGGIKFTKGMGNTLNERINQNRPGRNNKETYGHLNQTKDQILATYNTNLNPVVDPAATVNPEDQTETTDTTAADQAMAANQFGAGSEVASFAAGWKSRRGLRARAGRNAQGYASMRIAPTYASGIGTNYG